MSSLTAQAKQFPLKKPGGFHWDFFLLGVTTFIGGIFGLPLPNGLVPQAPIHTDSLCVYQTDLKVIRTEDVEGEEIRRPEGLSSPQNTPKKELDYLRHNIPTRDPGAYNFHLKL